MYCVAHGIDQLIGRQRARSHNAHTGDRRLQVVGIELGLRSPIEPCLMHIGDNADDGCRFIAEPDHFMT